MKTFGGVRFSYVLLEPSLYPPKRPTEPCPPISLPASPGRPRPSPPFRPRVSPTPREVDESDHHRPPLHGPSPHPCHSHPRPTIRCSTARPGPHCGTRPFPRWAGARSVRFTHRLGPPTRPQPRTLHHGPPPPPPHPHPGLHPTMPTPQRTANLQGHPAIRNCSCSWFSYVLLWILWGRAAVFCCSMFVGLYALFACFTKTYSSPLFVW
jgi:hypothetical protein